jgi:hypothetical protein
MGNNSKTKIFIPRVHNIIKENFKRNIAVSVINTGEKKKVNENSTPVLCLTYIISYYVINILVVKRNCALLKNQLKINIKIKFINCEHYIFE